MRVRIHRGTKEIGGTCVELEADGQRLLLDLGLPLDGDPDNEAVHPAIEGLAGGGDLLALVLSHGHVDHWGLAHLAGPDLPVALDAMRQRVRSAALGAPAGSSLSPAVAELVAAGRPPRIDPTPRLLVFGFDAAQRDDSVWKAHRDRLEKEFGLTVRAIGNTRGRVAAAFG